MAIFISVFLPLALVVIMFSLGLGLGWEDFRRVVEKPRAFAVGFAGQLLLVPAVAYAIILLFAPAPDIATGIMILSFCPGGMSSNMLTRMAKGDVALAVSLTTVSTLLSIVTLPLLAGLAAWHFMGRGGLDIDITGLSLQVLLLTAVPVAIGVAIKVRAPDFAARIDPHVARMATLLFVVIIVAAIAANREAFLRHLATLGPALITMFFVLGAAAYGLARLAGLGYAQTTSITIEVGIQNATLGMTVGALMVGQPELLPPYSLPAAVYGALMYVLVLPFVFWRRQHVAPAKAGRDVTA